MVGMEGKKHSAETKRKMSLASRGNKRWLGKKHKPETLLKMSIARLKNNPMKNPEVIKRRSATLKKNGTFAGENSNNWKGGKTKIGAAIRSSAEYAIWRKSIFERDDWTCQKCGIRSKAGVNCVLQVHHIVSFAKLIHRLEIKNMFQAVSCKELWNTDNGETLCKLCHKQTQSFCKNVEHHA